MKKIVFTGGGTLGHVMPNVYLMEELADWDISYIGTNGIEKERVKDKVNHYYEITATKLVRGKFFKNLKIPFVLIKSIFQSKKILKQIKPDVVFSKGGYVALPVCIAAKMLKIPVVAHESDFSFGLANKIILKTCNKMCVNFKILEQRNTKRKQKIVYTGPVLSKSFGSKTRDKSKLNLEENKPTILIVGGSLGSQRINENLFPIVKDLIEKFNIIHITGKGNLKIKSFKNYNAFEMTSDMVNLYNLSDFVIGRAGAGVTAESCFKKLPMLLIPLEIASRGDQVQNAKFYEDLGVAKIVHEQDLTPTKLKFEVEDFAKNLKTYNQNYEKLNYVNGREMIVEMIKNFAEKQKN